MSVIIFKIKYTGTICQCVHNIVLQMAMKKIIDNIKNYAIMNWKYGYW